MKIRSKKAFIGKTTELIFTLIAYVVLVVICMFFIGIAKIQVEAELNSVNAHFTCSNNLMSFLKLHASPDEPMEELLLSSYVSYKSNPLNNTKQEFSQFEKNSTKLFDSTLGSGEWSLIVSDSEEALLILGGINGSDETEICNTYLPVPCSKDASCLLTVDMIVPIKK